MKQLIEHDTKKTLETLLDNSRNFYQTPCNRAYKALKNDITNITVFFQGTKKGKRKIAMQSERIDQLEGHVTLTPDQFNDYERKAWTLLDNLGYKNAVSGSIVVNFGHEDNGMVFVQLLPKQKQLIMRSK